jgi:glycosyltransferase involved in cell wall biosynthesis
MTSVSLVIPAHNEAENIGGMVTRSRDALADLTTDYEIVLVDDGSSDGTSDVAATALGSDVDHLKVITHAQKSGYGVTVCDGLRAGTKEVLAFIDGDGQFDPKDIAKLMALIGQFDLVTGRRAKRADPWHRSVVSGTFNVLIRILYGVRIRDIDCGLKVMRREVFDSSLPIIARSAVFNTEMYFKARRNGFRIKQIDVPHYPRIAGTRSGGRLIPILRAVRDVVRLRLALRAWKPQSQYSEASLQGHDQSTSHTSRSISKTLE